MNTKLRLFSASLLTLLIAFASAGCGRKLNTEPSLNADLTGTWAGALEVNKTKLRLVLKITKATDGTWSATMDSPDQGAKDLPITTIEFNNPAMKLVMEGQGARFEGSLNKQGTEIFGHWRQGQKPLELAFRRVDASELERSSAQLSYTLPPGSPPDIRGYWKGTLMVQGAPLRLGLKIGRAEDGSFSAAMDSLDQGARDILATAITFKSKDVKMEWKPLSATFAGVLAPDGKTMSGQWTQGGQPFPLVFERTEEAFTLASLSGAGLSFQPAAGTRALEGYWKGELITGQVVLRLILKIGKAQDNTYLGTMDSVDQGAKDIPMSTTTLNDGNVRLEWSAIRATYEGKVSDDGTELAGTFNQGPLKNVFLTFARIESPTVPPERTVR